MKLNILYFGRGTYVQFGTKIHEVLIHNNQMKEDK